MAMDLINTILKPCLSPASDALVRQFRYLMKAKTITKELAEATGDLGARRNDIQTEIEAAVRERKRCTQQVGRWLEKVSETEREVTTIQSDYEGRSSGCHLFGSARTPNYCCWSSYRTGRRASKLLKKVIALEKERADFGDNILTPQPAATEGQAINTSTSSTRAGTMMASYIDKVRGYLEGEGGEYVIGIWGMGGVGKTTLLKEINNRYLHHSAVEGTKFFDHVIFVVVSKDHRLENLQKDIRESLGLLSSGNVRSQANVIFDFLKEKNFLLLLDDAWEAVDLTAIGIPTHARNDTDRRHRRKVVVTTRSEEVCGQMDSRKRIRVECLGKEEAWNLFKDKVGEELLDSRHDLVSLAQQVAKECGGLPLALIVIGRAMSTKRTSEAWNYAITQLRKSQPNNIPGMEDSMFPILKFSYDGLHDDTMRGCFLCCSLWPEDYEISKDELILAWMGLGLIDDFDDINQAYDHGHSIIESLIATSLLEPVGDGINYEVKMHDVIRDLALWIACDCGKERNRWIVKARANLEQVPSDMAANKWGEARRISLAYNHIGELPRNLPAAYCPNLSLLLLQRNELKELPVGFLGCMPNLTYLDLSVNWKLEKIPDEIGCLVQLRYLNLSCTGISSLPDEMGQLSNLKYLLLRNTRNLGPVNIPSRSVVLWSLLLKLEFLDLYPYSELCSYDDDELTMMMMKALGVKTKSLKNLQQLSLHHRVPIISLRMEGMEDSPSSPFHLHDQFNSATRGCLRELDISDWHSLREVVMDVAITLPKLEVLVIKNLEKLREIVWKSVVPSQCFRGLRYLVVEKCPLLTNITWILHLPSLERLYVTSCDAMEQLIIIGGKQVDGASAAAGQQMMMISSSSSSTVTTTFPCLKRLYLIRLPRLREIGGGGGGGSDDYALRLNFPCLEHVIVADCPELKKLPFCPQVNCNKLEKIEGSSIWWDSIEWEDDSHKSSLQPFFN